MGKYPKFHYDIIQRDEEWYKLRSLRVTGSKAQAIANCGKGLESYIVSLVSSHYSSSNRNVFCSEAMKNGIEKEYEARCIFELETDIPVKECGFISFNDFVGCSVDGLIDDGIIEIKCFTDPIYFDYLMNNKIKSEHLWQCQMNLLISGRKVCKYIAYNSNFDCNISIKNIYPDKDKFNKLLNGFKISKELILKYIEKYEQLKKK